MELQPFLFQSMTADHQAMTKATSAVPKMENLTSFFGGSPRQTAFFAPATSPAVTPVLSISKQVILRQEAPQSSDERTAEMESPAERLESIRLARQDVVVSEQSRGEFSFINPDLLHLIPHIPALGQANPRVVIFRGLVTLLGRRNQLEISTSDSPEALQAVNAEILTAEQDVRTSVIEYLRRNPDRLSQPRVQLLAGSTLEQATLFIDSTAVIAEVSVASHDVLIGGRTIHLNPVVPLDTTDLVARARHVRSEMQELRRTRSGLMRQRRGIRGTGFSQSSQREAIGQEITALDEQIRLLQQQVDALEADRNSARGFGYHTVLGTLVERPGGYVSGNSVTPNPELLERYTSSFPDNQRQIASHYMQIIARAEGIYTSLNTWDRLRITLGPGLGASGRLQRVFSQFYDQNPADFERLFGRYGIGVIRGSGRGNDRFTVVNDTGELLIGDEATEYIANNPQLLGVLVNAGYDEAWQYQLMAGGANSIRGALSASFILTTSGHRIGIVLFDLLSGHVTYDLLARSMFAFADDIHGSGHIALANLTRLSNMYRDLSTQHHFALNAPESMPDQARTVLAQEHVSEATHRNRITHIDAVLISATQTDR